MDVEQQVAHVVLVAKRQIGMLRREIDYQVSHGKTNKEEMKQAYKRLQQEISRGRYVLARLSTCLEVSGANPHECEQIASLQALLEEAVEERSRMYETIFGNQKKDSLKAFKESIHSMIQQGEGPSWIATVTKEEVINHGQEINRLFQFLVEGCGSCGGIPLVDSLTLARASERIDLFTPKQCETLRKQSIEADRLMLKETERLVQDLEEKEESNAFALFDVSHDHESLQASGWECETCTFRNVHGSNCCDACQSQRGVSFLAVAKRKPATKSDAFTSRGLNKAVVVKKRPARGSSTNTVWIRNDDVPELIGPRGKNQKELIRKTGAISIYAFQERLDENGMCPIEIQGGREVFQNVVDLLEKKFNTNTKQTEHSKPPSNINQGMSKEVVWIRNSDVPEMIGPSGKTVQGLKTVTGAKSITAWQELVADDGMCPIVIRGRPESVKKAAASIMNMFCGIPDSSRSASIDSKTSEPSTPPVQRNVAASIHSGTMEACEMKMPPTFESTARSLITNEQLHDATIALKSYLGVDSCPNHNRTYSILDFLQENCDCLSCEVSDFHSWLLSVQISTFEDLAEALEDDEFVRKEMKGNGLKYFKRFIMKKKVSNHLSAISQKKTAPSTNPEPPMDLVCPIRHALMVNDPVLASDGYTYEREAIMEWVEREGGEALSPMTHKPLGDAFISNVVVRTMARDWYQKHKQV